MGTESECFGSAMAALCSHGWGSLVLGVQNARKGFDAYWTPLFGDGRRAGQKCEEDVDWIEPVEGSEHRYLMTYSGLRLVIRTIKARRLPVMQSPRGNRHGLVVCSPSGVTV